jgi:hypothetical protein
MSISDRRRVSALALIVIGTTLFRIVACVPGEACLRNSDCSDDRICSDGLCILPAPEPGLGPVARDAGTDARDARAEAAADPPPAEPPETAEPEPPETDPPPEDAADDI